MNEKSTRFDRTKGLVLICLGLGTFWFLNAFSTIFIALVMGALFAYLLNPITRFVTQRSNLSHRFAARLVFAGFLLILLAFSTTLGKVAVDRFHLLEGEFSEAIISVESWLSRPVVIFGFIFHPETAVLNLDKVFRNSLASIPGISVNILSSFTSNFILGLIFIASFYHLLVDGYNLQVWLKEVTREKDWADFWRLLAELNKIWGVFLRVQLLMFVILGVMMGAGFLLVIWLFRSGLIPFSPLMFIALGVLVVTIAQQIDNLWLRPQLMGKSLMLHPWFIFVGLTATLISGNFLAVFFVVPVMATVKILGRYFHKKLLGLPPWPEFPAQA